MKLLDVKAGMNPRSARIFLAEKGIDIPRVAIDMQAGRIGCRNRITIRWLSISATLMGYAMAIARRSVEPPAHLAEQDGTALPLSVDVRRKGQVGVCQERYAPRPFTEQSSLS